MATFQARYGGHCDACEESIVPGERVLYVDDNVLVHAGCADSELRVRRRPAKEVVCKTCFLIKPCGCDDEGTAA